MDGLVATRAIRESVPECQVVLVSGSMFLDYEEGLGAARAAGAAGYVLKSRAVLDLAEVCVSTCTGAGSAPLQ
jgi:DNA-binding NarL/FixJ family response regulator